MAKPPRSHRKDPVTIEQVRAWIQSGQAAMAEPVLKEMLVGQPDKVELHLMMAATLKQLKRFPESLSSLERALVKAPTNPDLLHARAELLMEVGRPGEAIASLKLALQFRPSVVGWTVLLGACQELISDFDSAVETYTSMLVLNPHDIHALQRIAEIFLRRENFKDASDVLEVLVAHQPRHAPTRKLLGLTLARLRQSRRAADHLRVASHLAPSDAEILKVLAEMLELIGDDDESLQTIRKYAAHPDAGIDAKVAAANTLSRLGSFAEAKNLLDGSEPLHRLAQAMLMPHVVSGVEEIRALRTSLSSQLDELIRTEAKIDRLERRLPITNFYLGYHGENDRELIEQTTKARLSVCPELSYQSTNLDRSPIAGRRLKVGFASAHLRKHSVGRVMNGLIRGLDREQFEVVVFELPGKLDEELQKVRSSVEKSIQVLPDLADARAKIERESLDVLVFPDIHLDPFTDYLAHSRLAPVQCTTWGHPGTAGRGTIDYWFSHQDWEPEGNEQFYSEKLVRMRNVPMVAEPLSVPETILTRSQLGIPEGTLYACAQTLFKLHPNFDDLVAEVLRGDPEAHVVMVGSVHERWNQVYRGRYERRHPDVVDRIVFLPHLSSEQYMSLLTHCAVSLDPIEFGGANTSMEAFRAGLPVVTWPGQQMRARVTHSFYQAMGISELTATSQESYVELALGIGKDSERRAHWGSLVREKCEVLFGDQGAVAEFGQTLFAVAAGTI